VAVGAPAPAAAVVAQADWAVVIAAATLLGIYVGAETGFGAYVTAYAVLELGSTEAHGQLLAGGFWAAITAGRFAAIWVASRLSPGAYLRASMGGSAASALLLILAGGSEAGLWVASLLFGFAMAPVFPTAISLVESYFPVLGKHATVLRVGSAAGEMVLPAIIAAAAFGGATAEEDVAGDETRTESAAAPRALLYVVAAACVANGALLLGVQKLGERARALRAAA
jgi:fucose permease